MSYGLPVIATRVGAIDHVIDSGVTGWICEPGDPQALAEAINLAVSDLDNFVRVGAAGRDSLHPRFSPLERAQRMRALYTQLVASKAA